MALKDRLHQMGFMPKIPDISEITGMMDERFNQLLSKLDEILQELKKANARNAPL